MSKKENDYQLPSTVDGGQKGSVIDVYTFGNAELQNLNQVCDTVRQVTCTIAEAVKYVENVKLEIKRLDAQMQFFIAQTKANVEKFKTVMPVFESQLNNLSRQIDKITDAIIDNTRGSNMTKTDMQKQELLLNMLANVNDNFNNLLAKILL